jgi:hypothetical protein
MELGAWSKESLTKSYNLVKRLTNHPKSSLFHQVYNPTGNTPLKIPLHSGAAFIFLMAFAL